MGKNSLKRSNATMQNGNSVGTISEEHIVIDNNPMPSADELTKYQSVHPDLVSYFMRITDEERALRHELAKRSMSAIEDDNKRSHFNRRLGMTLALIALLVFLAITAYALYLDHPWIAGLFSTLSIATIVTAFINNNKPEERQG